MPDFEYFEFDYHGRRHDTMELPVPLWLRVARKIRLSPCKLYGCDDHGEIFCKTHGEVTDEDLTRDMRKMVHEMIGYAKESRQL